MILRGAGQPTWTRQLGTPATGFRTLNIAQFQICRVKITMRLPLGHNVYTVIAIIVELEYGLCIEPFIGSFNII